MKKLLNFYKTKQNSYWKRGSLTVEMSLIFPFILLTILAIIYIVIILYQYALLQSQVNHTAEAAGRGWGKLLIYEDITPLMKTGHVDKRDIKTPLYWRLLLLEDVSTKERKVELYLEDQLKVQSILGIKNHLVKVEYKDYIINKEIIVTVSLKYHIPLPLINQIMGLRNGYTVNVSGRSMVRDSTEFIRTIDFATDLMEDFEITKFIKNKHQEILLWVKEKISDNFQ